MTNSSESLDIEIESEEVEILNEDETLETESIEKAEEEETSNFETYEEAKEEIDDEEETIESDEPEDENDYASDESEEATEDQLEETNEEIDETTNDEEDSEVEIVNGEVVEKDSPETTEPEKTEETVEETDNTEESTSLDYEETTKSSEDTSGETSDESKEDILESTAFETNEAETSINIASESEIDEEDIIEETEYFDIQIATESIIEVETVYATSTESEAEVANEVKNIRPRLSATSSTITTWAALAAALRDASEDTDIKLSADIAPTSADTTLEFDKPGITVTLDLAGRSITMNKVGDILNIKNGTFVLKDSSSTKTGSLQHSDSDINLGRAINVTSGTFIMDGGKILNNRTERGGGVLVNNGYFVMNDGIIMDNYCTVGGGGVYMFNGVDFVMNGGIIRRNAAPDGGGIYFDGGTFRMKGGSVLRNSSSNKGAGIYYHSGRIYLSGAVEINSNTSMGGASNIHIYAGRQLYIENKLQNTTPIGVAYEESRIFEFTVDFPDYHPGEDITTYFSSDDSTCTLRNSSFDEGEIVPLTTISNWSQLQGEMQDLTEDKIVVLAASISPGSSDDTLTLTNSNGKTLTIDLAGFDIKMNKDDGLEHPCIRVLDGNLVIRDSSTTGSITHEDETTLGVGIVVEGAGCKLTLESGEIWANYGGGVYLHPDTEFTMNNGMILANGGDDSLYNENLLGGGVYVSASATFNLNGGGIHFNYGLQGGGIYARSNISVSGAVSE